MNKKILKIVILILIIMIEVLSVPKVDYGAGTNLKLGDVNGDGIIDSRDTLKILEHIAASNVPKIKQKHSDWILKGDKLKTADINEDGLVDSRDTIKELEYIAATTIPKIGQKHSNWKKYIEDKWKIEATGISLNNTNIKIAKGKITKLTATISPKNVTNKVVKWSSSNEKIATVDGLGNVTGKSEGTAIITATTNNGKTAKAQITVSGTSKQQPVKTTKSISKVSVKLSSTSVAYNGKVQTPGITLKDGNTTLKKGTDYTVSYSNNKKVGKATITIAGKGNYTGKVTKKFTITKAPMSRVSVLGIEDKAYTGKQITQNIKVKDGNTVLKNGTDYTVKYQANKNIGQNAKIMIVGKGNYTGTIIRTFSIVSIKGTKIITSAPLYRNIEKGKYVQLTAKVSPDNATYKTITWSSSNTKVATVDNKGKIHIVGHGTAKITATQKENKLTATYTIVGYTPAKSISLNKNTITINKESTQKLTVSFNPTNTSSKAIIWKSSNTSVATVDNKGVVKAISKGTATITATSTYGKSATCKVTVTEQAYPENEKISGKSVTKGQYANFRNVCAGNMAPGVLYRCINPIMPYSDKEKERAYYADRLLEAHKVNIVISLSDTINRMKTKGYSKATYYKKLLNSGRVYVYNIKDDGTYGTTEKKKAIVKLLKVIINKPGPYAIHCKWGQGRTGFIIMLLECLMDAPYEYMYNDFTASFKNLNHSGANKEFSKYMKSITGKSAANSNNPKADDWKNVNFVKCAENYLKEGGMSSNEIKTLKNRLAGL